MLLGNWVMIVKAEFVYVGIRVKELQESIDFYAGLLGMKVIFRGRFRQTKGEVVHLKSERSDFILELNYYEMDSPYNTEYSVGEGLDHLAFKVENLSKALEEARLSGHPAVLEIKDDGSRWAYIEDPNGIWIELY